MTGFLPVDDKSGVLSFDISPDGLCLAAGTELKGDEAHLIFWSVAWSLTRIDVVSQLTGTR